MHWFCTILGGNHAVHLILHPRSMSITDPSKLDICQQHLVAIISIPMGVKQMHWLCILGSFCDPCTSLCTQPFFGSASGGCPKPIKLGGATKFLPKVVEACAIAQNLSKLDEECIQIVFWRSQATGASTKAPSVQLSWRMGLAPQSEHSESIKTVHT